MRFRRRHKIVLDPEMNPQRASFFFEPDPAARFEMLRFLLFRDPQEIRIKVPCFRLA
jgi:hypothetical protein